MEDFDKIILKKSFKLKNLGTRKKTNLFILREGDQENQSGDYKLKSIRHEPSVNPCAHLTEITNLKMTDQTKKKSKCKLRIIVKISLR